MRLFLLFGFLVQIGPIVAEQCKTLPPGINRLAFGVDVTTLTLQPLDLTEPDGYKGVIIDFTCTESKNPGDGAWYQPGHGGYQPGYGEYQHGGHIPSDPQFPGEPPRRDPRDFRDTRGPYNPETSAWDKGLLSPSRGYNPQEKKRQHHLSSEKQQWKSKSPEKSTLELTDSSFNEVEDVLLSDDTFSDIEKRQGFPFSRDRFMPHGGHSGGGFWPGHNHDSSLSKFGTLPDQVAGIAEVPGGFMRAQYKKYRTTKDLTDKMTSVAGLDSKPLGVFSGSASYRTLSQEITKNFKEIMEVFAYVASYEVSLKPDVTLELTDSVKKVVDNLPDSFNKSPEAYYKFIAAFGTHYFAKGKLGGLVKQIHEISMEYFKKHSDRDAHLAVQGEYDKLTNAFGDGTAGGGVNKTNVKSDDDFAKYTTTHDVFLGGNLKLMEENGIKAWQETVHQKPWVFGADLAPIYELIRNEPKKLAMKQAVDAHLDKAYLNELKRTLHNMNRAIVKDLLSELNVQLKKTIPDHEKVVELGKKNTVIAPDWRKFVKLCYQYNWISTKSRKYVYEKPKCAYIGNFTEAYYDNTQSIYTDEIRIKDILNGKFKYLTVTNTRQISWGLEGPENADEWFWKVQFCYKYESTGAKEQCNAGKSLSEVCAPVNSFTPMYVDGTNDAPGGCKISWKLKAPNDAPLWFLSTQLCMKWKYHMSENNGECGRGSNETLCAYTNNWTPYYLDDTDSRGQIGSGCSMRWIIK